MHQRTNGVGTLRNIAAADVGAALDHIHATDRAYHEQIQVDGAQLGVGELRMGVELEIGETAEQARHAARPVPEAERGAAVASIVRAIQEAAARLIEQVLDRLIPGRARRVEDTPPTAATHETATTRASTKPSPERASARPTAAPTPTEDLPDRGAGEHADRAAVNASDRHIDPPPRRSRA